MKANNEPGASLFFFNHGRVGNWESELRAAVIWEENRLVSAAERGW